MENALTFELHIILRHPLFFHIGPFDGHPLFSGQTGERLHSISFSFKLGAQEIWSLTLPLGPSQFSGYRGRDLEWFIPDNADRSGRCVLVGEFRRSFPIWCSMRLGRVPSRVDWVRDWRCRWRTFVPMRPWYDIPIGNPSCDLVHRGYVFGLCVQAAVVKCILPAIIIVAIHHWAQACYAAHPGCRFIEAPSQ